MEIGPPAHGAGIVEQQRNHGVAELGVAFLLEAERRGGVGDDAGQAACVEDAFLQVEMPGPVLLCLQAALQAVGQPADRPLQGFELLVEIGAQAFQFRRFGKVLGGDFLVIAGIKDLVVGIGVGMRRGRRRVHRRFAILGLDILGHLGVVVLVVGDLGLGGVHLLGLAVLRFRVLVFLAVLILAAGIGLVLGALFRLGLGLVVLALVVGVVAQLVAIAEVRDHLAGEFRERFLVVEHLVGIGETVPGLALEEAFPQVHDVLCACGQVATRREVSEVVPGRLGQRGLPCLGDLGIALPPAFLGDLGVDVPGGSGHGARTHRLAARGFHRLVERLRDLALRAVAVVGGGIVEAAAQGIGIRRAARLQHLVPGHPAGDLRQARAVIGQARGVDRISHRQIGVVGDGPRGLAQRLLERLSRIVGWFAHHRLLGRLRGKRQAARPGWSRRRTGGNIGYVEYVPIFPARRRNSPVTTCKHAAFNKLHLFFQPLIYQPA